MDAEGGGVGVSWAGGMTSPADGVKRQGSGGRRQREAALEDVLSVKYQVGNIISNYFGCPGAVDARAKSSLSTTATVTSCLATISAATYLRLCILNPRRIMDESLPSISSGAVGSRFVTETEIDTAKARREEQWKAAYARYVP